MLKAGDLVKMRLGYSAPGTVLEVLDRHPMADQPGFMPVNSILKQQHARVFWSDDESALLVPTSQIVGLECE